MLQHVPVAWENAHPVIDTNDVEGVPDRLFRTFFGGQTAYAALLACDKLALNPNQLLLRSRRCFLKAAQQGLINLSIEGRRPGLDEDTQASIRYIIHERKRQMLFVQLFSVRRALVETGTVGPLWQQRQRLVTGKDAPPLNPPPLPPPLPPASSSNSNTNNSFNSNNNSMSGKLPPTSPKSNIASKISTTGPVMIGRRNLLRSGSADSAKKNSSSENNSKRNSIDGINNTSNNNRPKPLNGRDVMIKTDDNDEDPNVSSTLADENHWEEQLMRLQVTGSVAGDDSSSSPSSSPSYANTRKNSSALAVNTSGGIGENVLSSSTTNQALLPGGSSPGGKKKKIEHTKFPAVPEPAPLFRWRTPEVLDKEEEYLAETCSKLVQFSATFLRAEQSRLHEQLTQQQEELEERKRKREEERKILRLQSRNNSALGPVSPELLDDESSFLTNPALMGFAQHQSRPSTSATTIDTTSHSLGLNRTHPSTANGSPGFDTESDDDDNNDDNPKRQSEMFSRPSTVGGKSSGVGKVPSSYLWTLGESPFSIAGTRPPRPPTQRQQLVTKFGKVIGDDYVSKTVSRHLKIIAKKAAEHISDTVQLNAKDDEIRGEMENFHMERKSLKTAGPYIGKGFEHAGELTEAEQRKMQLEYQTELRAHEQIEKLRNRHEKQEIRKYEIDDRKLTSRAIQREVSLVRRENVKSNRERIDHLGEARRLVTQVSREGRHERVDLLHQQHRAAAWNSRVSHEMEAMIRAQVKDKVKSMQLTRRWELGELPSAEELAEIFHSEMVIQSWNNGVDEGIAPLKQKALEEQLKYEEEERLLAKKQKEQEQLMLERGNAGELRTGLNNASVVHSSSGVAPPARSSNFNTVEFGQSIRKLSDDNSASAILPNINNNPNSSQRFNSSGTVFNDSMMNQFNNNGNNTTSTTTPRPPPVPPKRPSGSGRSSNNKARRNSSEEVAWGK